MKIVGMIPARLGSKRIFQKNLRILGGKPLIAHIIESALATQKFDEIYINSESEIFEEIAINYGIKVNNRLAFLLADQQLGDFPPTNQAEEVYDVLAKELDGYLNQLKPLIKTGVETLNAEAQKRQIPLLKEKG